MSDSNDLTIIGGRKTVTAAGTCEPLLVGRYEDVHVRAISIRALRTNTGNVYIGNGVVAAASASDILAAGERLNFSVEAEEWKNGVAFNLSRIYLDVDTSGEGVSFSYVRD